MLYTRPNNPATNCFHSAAGLIVGIAFLTLASLDLYAADESFSRGPVALVPNTKPSIAVINSTGVQKLIRMLDADDSTTRNEAAGRLAWMGPEAISAVPALKERLLDSDPIVRATSARALWEITNDPQQPVAVLSDLLLSTQPGVSALSAYILGNIGPAARPALSQLSTAFSTTNELQRVHLAEAIAKIDPRNQQAVFLLIDSLKSNDSSVRTQAAFALGTVSPIYENEVSGALRSALRDEDDQVRSAVQNSLSTLPAASEALRPVATNSSTIRRLDDSGRISPAFQPAEVPSEQEQQRELFQRVFKRPVPGDVSTASIQPDSEQTGRAVVAGVRATAYQQRLGRHNVEVDQHAGLKPISNLTLNIVPSDGSFPADHAAAQFSGIPQNYHSTGTSREWPLHSYEWLPSELVHGPTLLEETNLERYGHTIGILQPAASAAMFYGRLPSLPYKSALRPALAREYELGYHRPGSDPPFQLARFPLRPWPAFVQAAITTGLIFAIP